MDNTDLLRALSSTAVHIFGVALIVLIGGLSADGSSLFRPLAYLAAIVMLVIAANWIVEATGRIHAERHHEPQ